MKPHNLRVRSLIEAFMENGTYTVKPSELRKSRNSSLRNHIIRDPERNEYYEITEKGEKVLKAFLDFENVLSKI